MTNAPITLRTLHIANGGRYAFTAPGVARDLGAVGEPIRPYLGERDGVTVALPPAAEAKVVEHLFNLPPGENGRRPVTRRPIAALGADDYTLDTAETVKVTA